MTERARRELTVWLHGEEVAGLADRRGRLALGYRPEVVERLGLGSLCLSVALPVRAEPFRGDRVERWVEGLLPEGETRTVLERRCARHQADWVHNRQTTRESR